MPVLHHSSQIRHTSASLSRSNTQYNVVAQAPPNTWLCRLLVLVRLETELRPLVEQPRALAIAN